MKKIIFVALSIITTNCYCQQLTDKKFDLYCHSTLDSNNNHLQEVHSFIITPTSIIQVNTDHNISLLLNVTKATYNSSTDEYIYTINKSESLRYKPKTKQIIMVKLKNSGIYGRCTTTY